MSAELLQRTAIAAIVAMAGVFVGWGGTALTLAGRVDAIEAGQLRVEIILYKVLAASLNKTVEPHEDPAKPPTPQKPAVKRPAVERQK